MRFDGMTLFREDQPRHGIDDRALVDRAARRVVPEEGLGVEERAEVPVQEGRRGHGRVVWAQHEPGLAVILERTEVERPVLENRAAHAHTADVLAVRGLLELVGAGGERVRHVPVLPGVRVEALVTQVAVAASVERVGAGLQREVEDAATGAAIFGRDAAGHDLELLDRLHRRARLADVAADLDDGRCAVEHDLFTEGKASGDPGRPVVPLNAGRQGVGEVLEAAPAADRQGQAGHDAVLHRRADLGGRRGQDRRVRGHGHRVLEPADVQRGVQGDGLRETDRDGLATQRGKSL